MLRIVVPSSEDWDDEHQNFIYYKSQALQLEHSLVSLSKWEAKWQKPFLTREERSEEETLDYIRDMTLTQNVDPEVYKRLSIENIRDINDYIDNPMTATTITDDKKTSSSREIITSEIVYYWMIALNIPFECQKWHLNRLLMLIRVCEIKSQPAKKMSRAETMNRNRALNKARRNRLHSKG